MDIGIVIGLALGLACIAISVLLDGGDLGAFVNLSAALITFGGTIGATMVSTSLKEMLKLPLLVRKALFGGGQIAAESTISRLVQFAQKARKEGLLALEGEIRGGEVHPFLVRGLQLIIDGTDEAGVRNILDSEIESIRRRHQIGQGIFGTMGGYAPTMGLIGAILGLIHVLGNLGGTEPESLGRGIATVFSPLLYGILSANILFLPLAGNLRAKSDEELFLHKVMVEGILGIQAGKNPRILEQKLRSFFPASDTGKTREAVQRSADFLRDGLSLTAEPAQARARR
ncbi:MAG: motility protein A [Candidatus Methylomirabilales bacterium]